MTLALENELASDENHLVLEGVSWETYESLVRDFEVSGQRKRITYDDGRMVIVSPLPKHEKWKKLLGSFIEAIAEEKDIPISGFGSTTWKKKRKKKGLEPDECFYIQNERLVRHRLDIDLKQDPPPDLAVEVDLRAFLMNKLKVYAGLGVHEVWCFDGIEFEMFVLNDSGSYEKVSKSSAMPFLEPEHLINFLKLFHELDHNSLMKHVRQWARKRRK